VLEQVRATCNGGSNTDTRFPAPRGGGYSSAAVGVATLAVSLLWLRVQECLIVRAAAVNATSVILGRSRVGIFPPTDSLLFPIALHRHELDDALGLEGQDGVGFELIVVGEAGVQADDAFGLLLRHGADQLQRERAVEADQHHAI
jgi:hypothetical protein